MNSQGGFDRRGALSYDKAGRQVDAGAGWALAAGEGENEPCGLSGHINERRIVVSGTYPPRDGQVVLTGD